MCHTHTLTLENPIQSLLTQLAPRAAVPPVGLPAAKLISTYLVSGY